MTRSRYRLGRFGLECVWSATGARVWINGWWSRSWARHLLRQWRWVYRGCAVQMRVVRRERAS